MSGAGIGAPEGPPGAAAPQPDLPEAARHWQARYERDGHLWGDDPSPLARLAVARLRTLARPTAAGPPPLEVVDLGCGYGRDAYFLAAELGCRVLGVDPAPAAVAAARAGAPPDLPVRFEAADPAALAAASPGAFDVVYSCNVYHLLRPEARREFAVAAARLARPGALLLFSTLAPGDPQHWQVGQPVPGERNSWLEHVYLHLAPEDELVREFAAFEMLDLTTRDYEEHNAGGALHRHRSWFVVARGVVSLPPTMKTETIWATTFTATAQPWNAVCCCSPASPAATSTTAAP
jgi:SAM-dependent methyltransferase